MIAKDLQKIIRTLPLSPGHDYNHLMRVYQNGVRIAKGMKLDPNVLAASLLLHDIDRENESTHARDSAEKARKIITALNFSVDKIRMVTTAIRLHSRSDLVSNQKTLYAQVLYDADKLDGLGKEAIKRVQDIQKSKNWSDQAAATWYLGRILDVAKNEPAYFPSTKKLAKKQLKESLDWCEKQLGELFAIQLRESGFGTSKEVTF